MYCYPCNYNLACSKTYCSKKCGTTTCEKCCTEYYYKIVDGICRSQVGHYPDCKDKASNYKHQCNGDIKNPCKNSNCEKPSCHKAQYLVDKRPKNYRKPTVTNTKYNKVIVDKKHVNPCEGCKRTPCYPCTEYCKNINCAKNQYELLPKTINDNCKKKDLCACKTSFQERIIDKIVNVHDKNYDPCTDNINPCVKTS